MRRIFSIGSSPVARYGIAFAACALALLLRLPLSVYLSGASPFIAFTPAILFAARFGGFGPGLLATVLSAALGAYLLLEPYEDFSVADPRDASQLGLLLVAGVIISYLGESTRSADEQVRMEQQALRESEERFQSVVEGVTGYAIFMLDRDGRVLSWNSGARQLTGYSFEEIVAQDVSRLYTAEDTAAGLPEQNRRRAEQEGASHLQGWRVRKDGARFWADVTLTALRRDDGKVHGYLKIIRDATAQKAAVDGQARLLAELASQSQQSPPPPTADATSS